MDYDALLRARIAGPLGMKDTGIALSAGMKARLARGHDDNYSQHRVGISPH